MQDTFTRIQQYARQNPIIVIIFIILQLVFLILLIVTINSINSNNYKTPSMPISNLQNQLQELPASSVNSIESILYGVVAKNQGTLQSISDSDATIREGTFVNQYFEKINMHYINFIVDIPSIKQSYQVFHEWSDDNNNKYYLIDRTTLAMCPISNQIIYEDFNCQDGSIYQYQGQRFLVSEFIKYFDFEYFTPKVNYKNQHQIDIDPISTNIDVVTKESFIKQTKDAINSLGILPDIFDYHVTTPDDITHYYDGS